MSSIRLHIRDVSEELVASLDKICKAEGYSSRSKLIVEILERYVVVSDKVYSEAMTAVTRSIIREEIKQLDNISTRSLQIIEAAALRFLQASQKIDTYLSDDFLIENKGSQDNFSSDRKDTT